MKTEQRQFIERVGALAAADMQASGVLASLTIAQAILESGWGTSELALSANALFGIKADSRWGGKAYSKDTKECYDDVNYTTITALFRAYESWEESVADHSAFLRAGSRYTAVIGEKDYKAACKSIEAAGYATAPDYAEKLVNLIEGYELTAYDGDTSKEESTMNNSPLVAYTKISPNRNSPRNHAIDTISIHCVVGQLSAETIGEVFAPSSREASSNYGIGADGKIGMYVEEKDRSWCTSSQSNDHRAITIECASDTTHPYAVNSKVYAALIDLCTDICKRNGIKELKWKADKSLIGQPDKQNMTVHRWFANKACPGDYLYNLHGQIAAEVNKRLNAAATPGQPEEKPGGNTDTGSFDVGDLVRFKGGPHYTNANAATAAATPAAGPAKVTDMAKGSKHPYHLVHTDSTSSVYGWVDAASIEKVSTGGGGASGSSTYTVKSGDCLSAIGAALGVDWHEIASLNGINAPYTIYTGQVLKVPCAGAQTATWQEYTVKKGDSLWAIASKLLGDGSRYKEIKKLSGLTSDTIYAGNVLKVPAK